MRLVITGAGGMLGHALARVMRSGGVDCRPYPRRALDVTDRRAVEAALRAERPDCVIHTAAFTQVDACESDPERAFAVNAEGTRHVAEAALTFGSRMLYVSTDYVFDGRKNSPYTEEDAPAPLNVYGESKLAGEGAVQDALPAGRWVIIRTAWMYGEGGKNFPDQILKQARANRSLTVVDDQIGNPTWSVEVARAIKVVVEARLTGIYHVVSEGVASWFELAREVLRLTGAQAPLRSTTTAALGRQARRPAYSALDTTKFQRATGMTLQTWQKALAAYLEECQLLASTG